tara:strand:- start:75 stop:815 length:741 start_codon:yes stop_codon:yes gene_type:complete
MKYLLLLIFIYIIYNFFTTQENFENSVISPDIYEAIKKKDRAKIVFRESIRQGATFNKYLTPTISPEHEYIIFYIDEDNYKKSLIKDIKKLKVPSKTSSSSKDVKFYKSRLELYNYLKKEDSKFDLTKWKSKTITCYDKECSVYLNDLDKDKYRIIILKKDGEQISTIRKVIEFSEDNPYRLFNFPASSEEEDIDYQLPFKIPVPCSYFNNKLDCPDDIVSTILTRCHWDDELEQCRKTYQKEYLT